MGAGVFTTSCTGFLDRKPRSQVSPEDYFTQEGHLAAATMKYYDMLPTHGEGWSVGRGRADDHTDNQITTEGSRYRFFPGQAKVPSTGGLPQGSVRAINSDIALIEAKLKAGEVNGNQNNINHYLGELHFFRALIYFDRLQEYGDYPIITEVLPDQQEVLVEHAKRKPRNEVARFIVKELDTATEMLRASGWNKQRITKPVAQLLKSRVALYEASWLTYFKDTPLCLVAPSGQVPKWSTTKALALTFKPKSITSLTKL